MLTGYFKFSVLYFILGNTHNGNIMIGMSFIGLIINESTVSIQNLLEEARLAVCAGSTGYILL